ncbi:MAG: cell division protein ZapD [Pseudomonadota bacterium]|jgi:cell division protein ZapD
MMPGGEHASACVRRQYTRKHPVILYEYPFNERIRTYLRLEHLLQRLSALIERTDPMDHHFAIQTLFEVVEVASRSDMKSDILKDLDKHKQVFNGYRGNPAISEAALNEFIAQLDGCFTELHESAGKIGQVLSENEFLSAIRSRVSIPGGTCEFDLPAYHHWQHLPPEQRQRDLRLWCGALQALSTGVYLLLRLLRDNGSPQKVLANGGVLQQNLPQGRTFQLLRLKLAADTGLVPEISGNRLLYAVRLMRINPEGKLQPCTDQDVALELSLCA